MAAGLDAHEETKRVELIMRSFLAATRSALHGLGISM